MSSASLWSLSGALFAIEAVAIAAFALPGVLAAARKHRDAVGVCVVTGPAAFGGGTLRDILLDRRPFFWVAHATWLWALMALAIGAMLLLRVRHLEPTERAMQWPDALGLGLFTASGTQIALDAMLPPVVAVLMGMITAVFGGVLRDIVCNETPSAFTRCAHTSAGGCSSSPTSSAHRSGPHWVRPSRPPPRCARSRSRAIRCGADSKASNGAAEPAALTAALSCVQPSAWRPIASPGSGPSNRFDKRNDLLR